MNNRSCPPEVLEQWLKYGTVPASYVASELGDQSRVVSMANPERELRGKVIAVGRPRASEPAIEQSPPQRSAPRE